MDLVIDHLDEHVARSLRQRAARKGRSVEDEAKDILVAELETRPPGGLFGALMDRFAELGGVDLDLPGRGGVARRLT